MDKITSLAVLRGRAGITKDPESGAICCDGPDAVNLYRLYSIYSGMEFEMRTGMRLTRKAPSCFALVKREHGLKGNRYRVYTAFCEMHGFDAKPESELQAPSRTR